MADIVGDEKEALLAETAAVGAAAGGAAEVGDFRNYLNAYYRHVALEDLTAAGPERLAATAIEQAKLAAYRPQGRPRRAPRAGTSWTSSPTTCHSSWTRSGWSSQSTT
jgi:hypothetical protein